MTSRTIPNTTPEHRYLATDEDEGHEIGLVIAIAVGGAWLFLCGLFAYAWRKNFPCKAKNKTCCSKSELASGNSADELADKSIIDLLPASTNEASVCPKDDVDVETGTAPVHSDDVEITIAPLFPVSGEPEGWVAELDSEHEAFPSVALYSAGGAGRPLTTAAQGGIYRAQGDSPLCLEDAECESPLPRVLTAAAAAVEAAMESPTSLVPITPGMESPTSLVPITHMADIEDDDRPGGNYIVDDMPLGKFSAQVAANRLLCCSGAGSSNGLDCSDPPCKPIFVVL